MVRLSSTLELLVEAGASSTEQFELLRWVRCLSPQGLADRPGVVALLGWVAHEAAASNSPGAAMPGSPTTPQVQVSRLREAGYLDLAGCERFDSWPGEPETVARIVDELRAALGQPAHPDEPTPPPAPSGRVSPGAEQGAVSCRTCRRQLPADARYCGYCGIRV